MKTQTLAVPAAIAAGFLVGCASQEKITDRADPNRPSVTHTQEGYDTFGRKWGDQTNQAPKTLTRNDFVLVNASGVITDIDYTEREMTLKRPNGQMETYVVDKRVERFNEAKVGDRVSVDYYIGFNAEVRKPTAEEEQNPLVVVDTAGKAGADLPPTAYTMRRIRAVVTIEGLDRKAETVTVKGPRGKYFVARVADPSRLEQVKIGDTILMTFTEAAAISLKPAPAE